MKPVRLLPLFATLLIPVLFAAPVAPTVRVLDSATEETLNRKIAIQPGGILTVSVDFGAIEITTNGTSEVVIDAYRKVSLASRKKEEELLAERPMVVEEKDGNVTLTARKKGGTSNTWNWSWSRGRKTEALFKISVPAKFNTTLDTSGGHIHVTDVAGKVKADTSGGGLKFVRITGQLHGDTSGGGISVADCRGDIHVDTSGGGIEVNGGGGSLGADTSGGPISVKSFGGAAKVETSGGGITIEDVAGEIDGSTSGGSISARLPSPLAGAVQLETSGGGITVRTAADASFRLDAETSGGGVSSELPVSFSGKRERDELKGDVNGGGDKTVKLRSSGGGIRVKKI
jgi:hypothetical protein